MQLQTAPQSDRMHPNWGSLGRFHIAEDIEHFIEKEFVHSDPTGATGLEAKMWDIPLGVLDQEDLPSQGIDPSTWIPDAPKGITALGSCTANASTAFLSWLLPQAEFAQMVETLGKTEFTGYDDVVAAERGAIGFYHGETQVMLKDTGQDVAWPPTDGGCSGPYVFDYMQSMGYAKSEKLAVGAVNVAGLLQTGPVMIGTPWLQAWFEPNSAGFVDGNGKRSFVQSQIAQGVAGGHEVVIRGIEKLAFLSGTGALDPYNTILRVRNSWDKSWADAGEFLVHLSTLAVLFGTQVDFRQMSIN